MTEFFNSKYGIYAITFILFVAMGWFLRFLYGPKGIFKDKNITYDGEEKDDDK